ncbi:unnamed protein product, partial [marine sediment metagenome]
MTEIIDAIYEKYLEPPVNTVLIQFSRALMEDEAKRTDRNPDDIFHILNDHNLKEINKIIEAG